MSYFNGALKSWRETSFVYLSLQKKSETRNKSITSKAMQYRQDIVMRMPITRVELIAIWIVTIRSIWHYSAIDFLRFGKFSPPICESCGATYRRNYETFSAL